MDWIGWLVILVLGFTLITYLPEIIDAWKRNKHD